MITHTRDPRFRLRKITHASRTVFVTSIAMMLTSLLALTGTINANAAAGSLSSVSLVVVSDGTTPFDANDSPGNDASATNGVLRTMDTITYRWDYSVGVAGDVTFTQQLSGGMRWDAASTGSCLQGASAISADRQTITCTLPNLVIGSGSYQVKAQALTQAHGLVKSTSVTSSGLTSNAVSTTISAAPKMILEHLTHTAKRQSKDGVAGLQVPTMQNLLIPGDPTKGFRGVEGFNGQPVTFTVTPPSSPAGAVLNGCAPGTIDGSRQPQVTGTAPYSVAGAGSWSCTQPGGAGTPVFVSITNMNTSLSVIPTKYSNNSDIPSTTGFVSTGAVNFWFPESSMPLGEVYTVTTRSTDFDPTSASGASNYGTGFSANQQPGAACVTTHPANCSYTTLNLRDLNFSTAVYQNLPTASSTSTGDGVAYPGQPVNFTAQVLSDSFNPSLTNFQNCFTWDPTLWNIPASGMPANGGYVVEYGNVVHTSDAARKSPNCGTYGDGSANWSSTVAGAGGVSAVTSVRVRWQYAINPGSLFTVFPLVRTTNPIAAGTPLGVFHEFKADQFTTRASTYAPATATGTGGQRALASDALVRNTIQWDVTNSTPGATRTVTVKPAVTNPYTSVVSTATNVSTVVTLPSACESFVFGSASITPVHTPANVGPDGIACTADDVSPAKLTFSLGDVQTGQTVAPITFSVNILNSTPVPSTRTVRSTISSVSDVARAAVRTASAALTLSSVASFALSKQSSVAKVTNNSQFTYTIGWANRLANTIGTSKIVDVLPFNGDARGTTGVAGLELISATTTSTGVTFEYTTLASATLEAAVAADPSGDTGVTWVSTKPATGVTGIRVNTPSLGPGAMGSASVVMGVSGVTPNAQISNDLSAKASFLDTPVVNGGLNTITSSTASVSGNVYDDLNYSWSKDAAEPGLATVEVSYTGYEFGVNGVDENGGGDDVAVSAPVSVSTDSSGNYLFSSVDPGKYTFAAATPSGYLLAATPAAPVVVLPNQIVTDRNFGFIVDVPDPILEDDAAATGEGIAKIVDVLANDTVDASTVVTAVGAGNQGGTITIAPDGLSVTYAPATGFVGTETFTYTVKDKARQTSSATVTMTVVGAPEAVNDSEYVVKNVAKTISVLSNDSGSSVQVTSVGSSPSGTVEIVSNGQSVKFTPTTGFTGVTSFDYTITDSIGQTSIATVSIRVLPPLVALNDAASTGLTFPVNGVAAGIPVTIPVLSNDSGFNFTKTSNTQPAHGTVTFSSAGEATYTPDGTYVGADSFTYTVTDEGGQTATATVTVTVSTPPVLVDDSARVAKGTSKTITVLANDEGVGLEVISVQGMSDTGGVAHGTATVNPNGTVTFTPSAGFTGLATFTYTTEDDYGQQLTATVRVNVVAPPTAEPISLTVTQSSTTTQELAQFVSVPAGSTVSAQSVTQPSFGTASVFSSTHIRYVAPSDQHGMATFTYTVVDDLGQTATSTVNMKVIPSPKAVADSKVTLIDTAVTVPVLVNDTGYEVEVSEVETPTHGTVSIVNNTVLFTPTDGWVGTEVFTYTIEDFLGQTSVTSVTVQVFGALVAADTAVTTTKTDAIEVPLSLPVGSSVVSAGGTSHGTFEIRGDGTLWFIPNGSFVGSFTVPYTIEDAAGQVATANIRVTVNDVQSAGTSSSEGAKARGSLPVTGTSSAFAVVFVSAAFAAIVSGVAMLRRKRD